MPTEFDPTIQYDGPKAAFASLTGSPLWGLTVDDVIAAALERGWTLHGNRRVPTPYGLGPLVSHFTTADGRNVIWIPSYGGVRGEDSALYHHDHKTFWILWQAGVRVLLIGGTSGIADWRHGDADLSVRAIRPGDVVLPWSFRTKAGHGGLPGTPYETFWPDHDVLLDDPFCPDLARPLRQKFQEYVERGAIRRVHTPADVRVALVLPDAPTFETDFDILMWLSISKMASALQPDRPPIATLHGDCVNPVLARHLGIHMVYYHMVSNYAQGLGVNHDIAGTLYDLYLHTFPPIALDVEFSLLESLAVPGGGDCRCVSDVHEAPLVFRHAMTQSEQG